MWFLSRYRPRSMTCMLVSQSVWRVSSAVSTHFIHLSINSGSRDKSLSVRRLLYIDYIFNKDFILYRDCVFYIDLVTYTIKETLCDNQNLVDVT